MTPRELTGWVPSERHEHFDADDNLTGYTVVIRESRINDADVAALLGLAQFEAELTRCGFHASIAKDTENGFVPETDYCPVCAGLEKWERIQREADAAWEKANPDAPPALSRPSDGRTPYMRFLSPDENEQLRQTRSRGGEHGNSPREGTPRA